MKVEYKPLYERLGRNLNHYRRGKRITQVRFSEAVGIDRSHLCAIEAGKIGVSLDVLFKMCDVLEIAPAQLFDFRE